MWTTWWCDGAKCPQLHPSPGCCGCDPPLRDYLSLVSVWIFEPNQYWGGDSFVGHWRTSISSPHSHSHFFIYLAFGPAFHSLLSILAIHVIKESQYILCTHPLKKGLDKKINIRLLTPVFIIIYQAKHNLWCPENVGWENFAKLKKSQVKYGKNGQKTAKSEWNIFFCHHIW